MWLSSICLLWVPIDYVLVIAVKYPLNCDTREITLLCVYVKIYRYQSWKFELIQGSYQFHDNDEKFHMFQATRNIFKKMLVENLS